MQKDDVPFAEFLVDIGVLSRGQFALMTNDAPLKKTLLESGAIGEDELRRVQAHFLGIPFVHLTEHDLDLALLALLPEPLCRKHEMIAMARQGDEVEVALLDIEQLAVLSPLDLPYRLKPRLTDRASLNRALLIYQKQLKASFVSDLDGLLLHALGQGVSTIHLEPQVSEMLVRYRIGGSLYQAMLLPAPTGTTIVGRLKKHARLFADSAMPQEGRFTLTRPTAEGEDKVLVRVLVLPATGGERITLSLMPAAQENASSSLESIGLHGVGLEDVHRALARESGLVLVIGPSGSGKTTFLRTLVNTLPRIGRHIATIEREVEHRLPLITQVATDGEGVISPAGALRAVLRQDANVVMLEEIRDAEVAAIAVSAAARGVLVLAGVEASDTIAGVEKLLSFGVDQSTLAPILSCIVTVGRRGRLCEHSRTPERIGRTQLNAIEEYADITRVMATLKEERQLDATAQWKDIVFYEARACERCQEGYMGTVGIQEVLPNPLLGGQPALSLLEDALYKAALGLIDVSSVILAS
jgi:type IV pilus assembly protein PilB